METVVRKLFDNRMLQIILSHADTDGITSALNLTWYAEILGCSVITCIERNPSDKMTTQMLNEVLASIDINEYRYVEVMISDRAFISEVANLPDHVHFSWFDHHEGSVLPMEEIHRLTNGNVRDIILKTDINHCGATITYEAIMDRLIDHYQPMYSKALEVWNKNVNLWDTFLWKKIYGDNPEMVTLGKKMGCIDKMYDDPAELFRVLYCYLVAGIGLNSDIVNNWVDNLYAEYNEMADAAYEEAVSKATKFGDDCVFIPIGRKFGSIVKERYSEEHPEAKIILTYTGRGASIYTVSDYSIPAYEIAKFIGSKYGLNGGGHPNAAGCSVISPEEDTNDELVYERLLVGLKEFFNK